MQSEDVNLPSTILRYAASVHTVFIHCGLHKTGTTSIQCACAVHRNILRAHRILYPRPDKWCGHHNLAWALTRDSRFDAAGITWRKIIREITGFDGDALLSSEDFESILHRPDILAAITKAILGAGREVCFVIYVRKREQYVESLYLELLKHGYSSSFGAYQREIQKTGFLKHEAWVYQFDMDRVWSTLRGVPGLRFVRRDYQASHGDCSVADFLSVLGLSKHAMRQFAGARFNQRHPSALSFSQFMVNRLQRPLYPEESSAIATLFPPTLATWSVGTPERPETKAGSGPIYYLNRVFSSRTVETFRQMAGPASARAAESKLRQLAKWWQGGGEPAEFNNYQLRAVLSRPPSFRFIKAAVKTDHATQINEVSEVHTGLRTIH